MRTEEDVWKIIDPDDIWVMDKLILSRKLGYICGPVGTDVPKPGWYIIRPCVNMKGLGLGAEKKWLDGNTDHLPHGYFWCEWFEGRQTFYPFLFPFRRCNMGSAKRLFLLTQTHLQN